MVIKISNSRAIELSLFGSVGVFLYSILSIPLIRKFLFGEKAKVLDEFSGDAEFKGDVVNFVGQAVLLIPYNLNVHFFSYFDFNDFNIAVFLFFMPVVYRYFSFCKNPFSFFLLAFLFFPAPLLFLSNFNKETILVLSLFFAFGYNKQLVVFSRGYFFIIYSILMRPYLLWVPMLLKCKNVFNMTIVLGVVFFIALSFDVSQKIVFRLFNRRLAEKAEDANSEIIQSVFVNSVGDVFRVLYEVCPQILFPFFLDPSFKTFVFQLYLNLFLILCFVFRNKYSNLLIYLFLLYVVLDPDLGAFFRHITSYFILFPLMLNLHLGRKNQSLCLERSYF